jgi:cysteine-rich repeat protein
VFVCGDGVQCGTEGCDDPIIGNGNGTTDLCDNDPDPNIGNCTPTGCGNGAISPGTGEQCDDGGTSPGDGCGPTCLTEYCGDGIENWDETLDKEDECDDGLTCSDGTSCNIDGDCTGIGDEVCIYRDDDCCSNSCTVNQVICGDGITCGDEQCDDDTDLTCKIISAGPGEVFGDDTGVTCIINLDGSDDCPVGEKCGPTNNDTCDFQCDIELCGNGIYQPWLGEECDNGGKCSDDPNVDCTINDVSGCNNPQTATCDLNNDGCDENCIIEFCGDGIPQSYEQCDDGKTCDAPGFEGCTDDSECSAGDGLCKVRNGDDCDNDTLNGGNCTETDCGNGVITPGEDCDDGAKNGTAASCCTSDCDFVAVDTPCGDTTDNACKNPDTCDVDGVCQANDEIVGFLCGDTTDDACKNPDKSPERVVKMVIPAPIPMSVMVMEFVKVIIFAVGVTMTAVT